MSKGAALCPEPTPFAFPPDRHPASLGARGTLSLSASRQWAVKEASAPPGAKPSQARSGRLKPVEEQREHDRDEGDDENAPQIVPGRVACALLHAPILQARRGGPSVRRLT